MDHDEDVEEMILIPNQMYGTHGKHVNLPGSRDLWARQRFLPVFH